MKRKRINSILIMILVLFAAAVFAACGSKVRADAELEGNYVPVVGEMLGVALVGEELDGFDLELKSGGKGTVTVDGQSGNIKWENDDGTVTLTVDGEKMVGQKGKDSIVFDDMLGMGLKLTFAKEGTEAANPELYLPETDKYMLGEWQSVDVTDILGDPVDPSEMAPDALKLSFHGDHTLDAVIGEEEFTGLKWSNLSEYGSVDSEEVKLTWDREGDGLKVDYVKDGTYYTFLCPKDPEAYQAAAGTEEETEIAEETEEDTEEETETAAKEAALPVPSDTTSVYGDYWDRDWYGWYDVESCTDEYEYLEGSWWDVCGAIYVHDDDTGTVCLFDEDGSADSLFCRAEVTFRPGITPDGCMMSETGTFWNVENNIGHADWLIDPGASDVSAFDHMICIEGEYEDEKGSFDYYIYLKPWGMDWEDVRAVDEDFLPGTYDSWYVNVMDGPMPDEIG